jgi:hypothetical protein
MLIVTSRNRLSVFCDKHRNACVCCRFKIQDFIFLPDRNFQNNFMWPCIDWVTSLISKSCRKQQVSNTSVTLTFIDISICPQCISKSEAVVVVIWIYNYLCNKCLSLLMLWIRILLRRGVLDTTLRDKVVSDLRQVGGFLQVLWFPPPIKLTATIYLKYWWKWH